jgi:hypothetical protein
MKFSMNKSGDVVAVRKRKVRQTGCAVHEKGPLPASVIKARAGILPSDPRDEMSDEEIEALDDTSPVKTIALDINELSTIRAALLLFQVTYENENAEGIRKEFAEEFTIGDGKKIIMPLGSADIAFLLGRLRAKPDDRKSYIIQFRYADNDQLYDEGEIHLTDEEYRRVRKFLAALLEAEEILCPNPDDSDDVRYIIWECAGGQSTDFGDLKKRWLDKTGGIQPMAKRHGIKL